MAKGLSVLQLFLAVAMYRINSKTGQEVCNFEVRTCKRGSVCPLAAV